MAEIAYELGNSLYINLTNRCTNACVFCIRKTEKGVGYDLWLDREPDTGEIIAALKEKDPLKYEEVVFCGYGEPLLRIKEVVEVARWLKEIGVKKVRINTNGLANRYHGRNILPELKGLVDVISISLNAQDAEAYQKVSRSRYGQEAYAEVLKFIEESKKYIPEVVVTVVRWEGVDVEETKKVAERLGVKLRVREFYGN
ncbi:TatD family nuclease-associated radical SAM protein [Carboxydothermus hydrogenoformans]|uniref:Radical SAM domain protein n=1 Tax=Carboxydothermus hydrogenoformans (strain ATCC BAA-161 / DSM 6008 / Z-2901) TaxID=246194 RepID=Q3ADK0_CARHZ|nr:TatD family nuclease-associated radical SAM protein [Carboxydothermus hydrogenoformans]ABB15134.1 radical SAM domain protein [Carboxydothermus hydrogenoformans Z-2901]